MTVTSVTNTYTYSLSDARNAFRNFAHLSRVNEIGQNYSAAEFWLGKAREAFAAR